MWKRFLRASSRRCRRGGTSPAGSGLGARWIVGVDAGKWMGTGMALRIPLGSWMCRRGSSPRLRQERRTRAGSESITRLSAGGTTSIRGWTPLVASLLRWTRAGSTRALSGLIARWCTGACSVMGCWTRLAASLWRWTPAGITPAGFGQTGPWCAGATRCGSGTGLGLMASSSWWTMAGLRCVGCGLAGQGCVGATRWGSGTGVGPGGSSRRLLRAETAGVGYAPMARWSAGGCTSPERA